MTIDSYSGEFSRIADNSADTTVFSECSNDTSDFIQSKEGDSSLSELSQADRNISETQKRSSIIPESPDLASITEYSHNTKSSKLTRSRSGCLSCRKRHKKCDETKPICRNCMQRNAFCEWPLPKKPISRKRSKKRKLVGSLPCDKVAPRTFLGTNFQQILANDATNTLNLSSKQDYQCNLNTLGQSSPGEQAAEPPIQTSMNSFPNSPLNYPSTNSHQLSSTIAASSFSLFDFFNMSFSPQTNNENDSPIIGGQNLFNFERKSSSSSDCSSLSSTPSLFSHKGNESLSTRQKTKGSTFQRTEKSQESHWQHNNSIQNSSSPLSISSSPSSITFENQQKFILRKFQFMAPSQQSLMFDSNRFRKCNELFHDFLFSIISLNKEIDLLKTGADINEFNLDKKNVLVNNTSRASFTKDLCLEHPNSEHDFNNLPSQIQRSKEKYYSVLCDRSNTIFQELSRSNSPPTNDDSNSPLFEDLYRQFTFSNFKRIVTSEEKIVLVQQFFRNVMPLLNIPTLGRKCLEKLIVIRLARSANNHKANIDDYLICSVLAISSRISDLQKVSISSLLSEEKDEKLLDCLGDRKDQTISLYNKSIALLINSMKSSDFGPELFAPSSKKNTEQYPSSTNPNEFLSILISSVLLFLIQLTSTSPETHRANLKAILTLVKSFHILALNDEKLLIDIGEPCKVALAQLFWFLVRLDISYSILYKEVPILTSSEDFFPYSTNSCNDEDDDIISPTVKNSLVQSFEQTGQHMNRGESIFNEAAAENHGNYLCYLATRILCLIYSNNNTLSEISSLAQQEYFRKWNTLKSELDDWFDMRPLELKCIVNNDRIDNIKHSKIQVSGKSSDIQFPILLFQDAPSTYLNQLYHLLNIQMLQYAKVNNVRDKNPIEETEAVEMILHAVKIIGINLNNDINSNGLMSLSFASVASSVLSDFSSNKKKHFVKGGKTRELLYYSYDCKILLDKFLRIEQSTGWPLSWKFSDF